MEGVQTMRNKILITGAGGFIGGHLTNLLKKNNNVICLDKKPLSEWYQLHDECENLINNLMDYSFIKYLLKECKQVFHLACNMGGMGFIANNKTDCMLSIIPDANIVKCSIERNIEKFFFASSACVYPDYAQGEKLTDLKEDTVYPAMPEDGYGWEKLFVERLLINAKEEGKLDSRIARYHNVYGPMGSYNDGREKAPAAMCRKVAECALNKSKEIEIWGDGNQTRSFMYIDDCIEGTMRVFNHHKFDIFNIGSEEQVSINTLLDTVEDVAGNKFPRKNVVGPRGVLNRNSNNEKVREILKWEPTIKLRDGIEKTYQWIYNQMSPV
jgi:nucleoside-diphosphate-sugar epimerase